MKSQNHSRTPRLVMTFLDQRYYCAAPRHPVVCRLWRMRPDSKDAPDRGQGSGGVEAAVAVTYAIGMESPTERYLYCVDSDEARARALFDRIVEGRLSPIHLGDVVEDHLWELGQTDGEFCGRPLQTDGNMV